MKLACYMFMVLNTLIVLTGEVKAASNTEYHLTDKSSDTASQSSLQETVRTILASHKDLKAVQESRQEAIHELRAAKGGYGPSIDIVGTSEIRDYNQTTLTRTSAGSGEIELMLVQPIWDGFATRSRVRSSQASLDSSTSLVLDSANTLALDGVVAHISLIWRKKSLELAQANVRSHERILAMASDRQAIGADTLADVTQTKGRLTIAKSTLEAAKASLKQGENDYSRLTQAAVPANLGSVKLPSRMFASTEEIFTIAQHSNQQILSLLANIKTAQADKELAQSANHPVLNFEAGAASGTYEANGEWINSVGAGVSLRWNIFNSGADKANILAADASMRETRLVANSFLDDLTLDIENSWTDYQTAMTQLAFYEEAAKYNKQTLELYLEQFNIGQRSLLDVLEAESELYNSNVQALTARANILVSSYTLYALAGTLLTELNIDSSEVLIKPAN